MLKRVAGQGVDKIGVLAQTQCGGGVDEVVVLVVMGVALVRAFGHFVGFGVVDGVA